MTLHLITATIAAALGFGAAWTWQGRAIDTLKLEVADDRIQQQRAARAALERATLQVVSAQNEAVVRAGLLRQSADAARRESDGLRESIATAMRAATANLDACTVTTHTLGGLLDQCGREYQELGAKADRHVSDVKTLMGAWPR